MEVEFTTTKESHFARGLGKGFRREKILAKSQKPAEAFFSSQTVSATPPYPSSLLIRLIHSFMYTNKEKTSIHEALTLATT